MCIVATCEQMCQMRKANMLNDMHVIVLKEVGFIVYPLRASVLYINSLNTPIQKNKSFFTLHNYKFFDIFAGERWTILLFFASWWQEWLKLLQFFSWTAFFFHCVAVPLGSLMWWTPLIVHFWTTFDNILCYLHI